MEKFPESKKSNKKNPSFTAPQIDGESKAGRRNTGPYNDYIRDNPEFGYRA